MEKLQTKVFLLLSLFLCNTRLISAFEKDSCTIGNNLLPPNYDRRVRPNEGKALDITVQLYIESFGKVDVSKMEMEAFGYMIQRWKDPRLSNISNTPVTLDGHDTSILWLPDVYCVNCRKSNLMAGKNRYQNMARISANGSIYFSTGITLVSSCEMNLRNFPFDTQQCELHLSSYAYPLEHLRFTWYKEIAVKSLSMDQFDVINMSTRMEYSDYVSGKFQISIATFKFERRVGFYFLQLYIPTAMLVCLSWAMFFLDSSHSGDRIAIGVTLFLTMIFLHGYANTSLPKVSYVKSLDIYMVVSLTAILLTIFESVLVTKMYAIIERRQMKNHQMKTLSSNKRHDNDRSPNCVPLLDNENVKYDVKLNGMSCLCQKKEGNCPKKDVTEEMRTLNSCICENESNGTDLVEKGKNEISDIKKKRRSTTPQIVERYSSIILPLSFILFNFWYYFQFAHGRHKHRST